MDSSIVINIPKKTCFSTISNKGTNEYRKYQHKLIYLEKSETIQPEQIPRKNKIVKKKKKKRENVDCELHYNKKKQQSQNENCSYKVLYSR